MYIRRNIQFLVINFFDIRMKINSQHVRYICFSTQRQLKGTSTGNWVWVVAFSFDIFQNSSYPKKEIINHERRKM